MWPRVGRSPRSRVRRTDRRKWEATIAREGDVVCDRAVVGSERRSIAELLAYARAGLDRVVVGDLAEEMAAGALVVDLRPVEQRERDGELPGATVIDRNVLEWRLDPTSVDRLNVIEGHDQRIVLVCNEGYASSLAAATLRQLGLARATDLVGGFQAWRAGRHWNAVYVDKAPDTVSWYQPDPAMSVRLLRAAAPPPASVIDVGAGASLLADRLLAAGWSDVTVLDIAATASPLVRERAGPAVQAITADVLSWAPPRTYDAWHDRAVFHFLTSPQDRVRYLDVATAAIRAGGALVVGTFAPDGPEQCSGLPTMRYGPAQLAAEFAAAFDLAGSATEQHHTPWGAMQPFTWVVLRRQ